MACKQTGAGFCTAFSGPIAGRAFNGNIYYTKPGCTSPKIPVTLTVSPTPTLSINSSSTTICEGNTVTLTASGVDTYTWSTSSNNASIAVNPTTTTSYTVDGYSTLCNNTQSLSVMINVNPLPSVSLSVSSPTICLGIGSIALTGSPAGGTYSGTAVTGNLLSIANAGTFTPMYSYTNSTSGCSNTATTTVIVANCTGFNSLSSSASTINIYPNPNNGNFVIYMSTAVDRVIEVTDLTGRIVLSIKSTDSKVPVNISDLSNGMYQVRIQSVNEQAILKIIKH